MDVKTAFLNGNLDTTIYVEPPEGFSRNPNLVWKLHKGLYGLKQAPRLWNQRLNQYLQSNGYQRSSLDPCFYFSSPNQQDFVMIIVWVDDLVIAGTKSAIPTVVNDLKKEFKM